MDQIASGGIATPRFNAQEIAQDRRGGDVSRAGLARPIVPIDPFD